MNKNARFRVDAELRLIVDVAKPFNGVGDAEMFRFIFEIGFVGRRAVADDCQLWYDGEGAGVTQVGQLKAFDD